MNEEQQLEQISDVQDKNGGLEQTQAQGTKEERTYSKEEVSDIVEKRLKREREKMEKEFTKRLDALEEAQKLSKLSEQEKAEYQAQKEREAFEEERKAFYAERDAFNKAQYKAEIQRQLNEAGLPDISDTLVGMEAEQVKAQIDVMKQAFVTQVNTQIENRIKASANTPVTPTTEQQALLTMEQIKAMSTQDIIKNKELVDKSLDAIYGQK